MTRITGRKQPVFQNIIEQSLKTMFFRIEHLCREYDQLNDTNREEKEDNIIKNVWAIEREWIIDNDYWQKMTAFSMEDDEDEAGTP